MVMSYKSIGELRENIGWCYSWDAKMQEIKFIY